MADWIDVIIRKRDGESLYPEEIKGFVEAITRDEIPPEQASALLMAMVLNGLEEDETCQMVTALMESGHAHRFTDLAHPPADIAETGGLGGSAALVALPIAASFGVKLPVMAEKSLRNVSGLMDKFESIPNFRTDINLSEFQDSVQTVGMAVIGQTMELAPADARMNQIRANTGASGGKSLTLASLLARKSSIGARGLVVEIACGSGGMVKTLSDALTFSDEILSVGDTLGFNIAGLITDRTQPLGRVIGDALEMQEAVEILKGGGNAEVRDVAVNLAAALLIIGQLVTDLKSARDRSREALRSLKAFHKFKEIVSNQSGDTQVLDNPDLLLRAQGKREVMVQRDGYIKSIDMQSLANAWMALGGSRTKRGDATDHRVGLIIHKKIGEKVEKGESIVTLLISEKSKIELAIEAVEDAFTISNEKVKQLKPILETFGNLR